MASKVKCEWCGLGFHKKGIKAHQKACAKATLAKEQANTNAVKIPWKQPTAEEYAQQEQLNDLNRKLSSLNTENQRLRRVISTQKEAMNALCNAMRELNDAERNF